MSVQMFAAPKEKASEFRRKRMIPESVLLNEKFNDVENDLKNVDEPRLKGHKMVFISSGLLVFGGKTSNGLPSNLLWHFNFSTQTWSKKAEDTDIQPAPVWSWSTSTCTHLVVQLLEANSLLKYSELGLRNWRNGKLLD